MKFKITKIVFHAVTGTYVDGPLQGQESTFNCSSWGSIYKTFKTVGITEIAGFTSAHSVEAIAPWYISNVRYNARFRQLARSMR